MDITLDDVRKQAMALSEEERAALGRELLSETQDGNDLSEEQRREIVAAWDKEIKRRVELYRDGKMKTIPAAQVFANLRARLDARVK
jgi:putative addiction module component (TIGR02574 family)